MFKMFKAPFRWIGEASHRGALAVKLHLQRPHQIYHLACIGVLVIMVVVVMVFVVLIMV